MKCPCDQLEHHSVLSIMLWKDTSEVIVRNTPKGVSSRCGFYMYRPT